MCPLARVFVLFAAFAVCPPVVADKYDSLCDRIIQLNQQAAQHHNSGNKEAAARAVDNAVDVFNQAIKLDAEHPQAYFNMGVFMLNVQRFEDSITYWELAKQRVQDQPRLLGVCDAQMELARFGLASTRRDNAYSNGQGSVVQALEHVKEQWGVFHAPQVAFDWATLEVMRSEVAGEEAWKMAEEKFSEAQLLAKSPAHFALKDFASIPCNEFELVSTDWRGTALAENVETLGEEGVVYGGAVRLFGEQEGRALEVEIDLRFSSGSFGLFQVDDATISGPDGVIVKATKTPQKGSNECGLLVQHKYVDLTTNVPLADLWSKRPPGAKPQMHNPYRAERTAPTPTRTRATQVTATIGGFAMTSYYHFLTEVLCRLNALLPRLNNDPSMTLVAPKGPKFVREYLALLTPPEVLKNRLVEISLPVRNQPLVHTRSLLAAQWTPPSLVASEQPTHCLPPAQCLQALRSVIVEAVAPTPRNDKPVVTVLFCSRGKNGETSRKLKHEEELLERLRSVGSNTKTEVQLVVFQGFELSANETVELFHSADIVVGVHGGALTNILFAKKHTAVLEIGFRGPHTRHYAHMAQALELSYSLFLLKPDERALAAEWVEIPDSVSDSLVRSVEEAVLRRSLSWQCVHREL